MRYLHHRMQQCPADEGILARARELASARQLASAPAMHIRPLQVCCRGGQKPSCSLVQCVIPSAMIASITCCGERLSCAREQHHYDTGEQPTSQPASYDGLSLHSSPGVCHDELEARLPFLWT